MDRGASEDVPVLIVAGSLVGLSAALLLRRHGVGVLAVDRHAGTAINARAGHFHLRTVEILRSAGLEEAVRRTSEEQYPPDGGISNVESLAGREIANYFPNLNAGVDEFSPTVRLFINQDALEPILRTRAAGLGARLRYRAECTSLAQDADGVTAVIRDLGGGSESTVRARYVVAADGNRSPVRERLGIGMHGHGLLSHSITIYFRALADLGPLLKGRNQGVHYVTNPLMRGLLPARQKRQRRLPGGQPGRGHLPPGGRRRLPVRPLGQRGRGDHRAAGAGAAAGRHRRAGHRCRHRQHRDLAGRGELRGPVR